MPAGLDGVGEALVLAEQLGLRLDGSSTASATASSAWYSWPVARATSQPCRAISMMSMAPMSAAGVALPIMSLLPSQASGAPRRLTAFSTCRA